ncbi:hypothetical protein [Pseudonocardia acaciae]|uniref:hypothetical protein n=1 Tax=Pseudonocardia acaciae TaxID=551276 RepID=UPI0005610373|nr:hypothetical protein [Pseudonocardia acaciae]
MAGPKISGTRWSVAVSLLVAAAMATIAFITVQQAGCHNPGHYVARGDGYELVGGCIEPDDLPVAPDPTPTAPASDARSPLRP